MPYDLFISYSRRDNEEGRITQLIERIKEDFASFAKRELIPFFEWMKFTGCKIGGSGFFRAFGNRGCCSRAFLLQRPSASPQTIGSITLSTAD